MPGLRDDEFLHLDGDAARSEFLEHHRGNLRGESFDKFPMATVSEVQNSIGDGGVVDGVGQIVARGGGGEIVVHPDADEEALGPGPFLFGDADLESDFEVGDGDAVCGVHEFISTRGAPVCAGIPAGRPRRFPTGFLSAR